MKFLLAAINAKYIHSNPAVYSLRAYAKERLPEADIMIGEYTINHRTDSVLQDLYEKKPDFIGFSCYIWNISHVLELVHDLHKVLPGVKIWLGGPEVSFDAEALLFREPDVDGIMRGEGEATFYELASALLAAENGGEPELSSIGGITFRTADGSIKENPGRAPLPMDSLPFAYEDVTEFENRIIYYESSRGCPFSCSYCLSSIDKSVRFRSLENVKRELDFFLERKVPQVKFVDRTFNCRREHTMGIWRHLLEHDNGVTNFHFEISADLLNKEEIALIGAMRPGLIQLEIGVQSTNLLTVGEIRRTMNLERLKWAVEQVRRFRNTHQHLDLIAGLPYEGMESFLHSFDEVYRMKPDQLQLGFLKVLKGSYMEEQTECYGLKYRMTPPYEVLATKWLDYGDVIRLKAMEEMVEVYYNSGQFTRTMERLSESFSRPSELFLRLADYYRENGLDGVSHSRLSRYEILYGFIRENERQKERLSAFRDSLMYDLYLRENAKSRPSFASDQSPHKEKLRAFFKMEEKAPRFLAGYEGYDSRQLANMAHLEFFEDGTAVVFDYRNRDPLDHNALALPVKDMEEAVNVP